MVPIISVTGTKGKTTTVSIIDSILRKLDLAVLKVDTTGHFLNGERKSTLEDSKKNWRLVPSVCPGRYLWEFYAQPELQENGVAVLECALGCSSLRGLGYRVHKVGVFLNVFEDHLGTSLRLKTRDDIAEAKKFVFSCIDSDGGYAVFNAEDARVVSKLGELPKNATLLPIGLTFEGFAIQDHLEQGGVAITVNDQKEVVVRSAVGDTIVADLKQIPWTFNGEYLPSVWNTLAAIGAVYGYLDGRLPSNIQPIIEAVHLDRYGGRLTLLENAQGVKIIADYAHEKNSLTQIARLARSQVGENGRVIGVVRLAYDRTDELVKETGRIIASEFDECVVYDKIDGYFRKAQKSPTHFQQVEGRTSQVLADAIREVNPHVNRIVREDEAIQYAAKIAKPQDVVVVIVNDDTKRSTQFIENYFEAVFV